MPEPVAADGSGVGPREGGLELLLLDEAGVVVVLLVELDVGDRAVPTAVAHTVAVLVGGALGRGDQLGEHAGERVDLVAAELGARRRARGLLGEDALEAEHEPVPHLPAGGGRISTL